MCWTFCWTKCWTLFLAKIQILPAISISSGDRLGKLLGDGAGEGNRTLVFSLEVSKYRSVFKGHSDIFRCFGPLRSLQSFPLSEWRLPAHARPSKPIGRLARLSSLPNFIRRTTADQRV